MAEENNTDNADSQSVTWHKPEWNEQGKCSWEGIQTQHVSKNAKAMLILPPTKVIPVIFLPGVMGTNLSSSKSSIEETIWRGDNDISVFIEWASKTGNERRKLLDPDTTKVDNRGKISDDIISPITDDGHLLPTRKSRGWGEVLHFSYGKFLSVFQGALLDDWQKAVKTVSSLQGNVEIPEPVGGVLSHLTEAILGTEDENESPMTADELKHFRQFLFPLHVFGYNWLQDNKTSASLLGIYIDKVLELYRCKHGHGLAIEKVILVTHSMGGLVARYVSQVLGYEDKILGIVHGVIPDLGSPAAYRRMKVGAAQEGPAGAVMGKSAEELMPVLARAPAPLQLLPSGKYCNGASWLTIKGGDANGGDLRLPQNQDPFGEIYLNKSLWWRLYEADIIDKDKKAVESNWDSYFKLVDTSVRRFMNEINKGGYHPNTFAFYGNKIDSDGSLLWNKTSVTYPKNMAEGDRKLKNNFREIKLPYSRSDIYTLISSKTPGDGTVPVESLNTIRHLPALKSSLATKVEHQGAYEVDSFKDIERRPAIRFTLRAIVKMVQGVSSPC
ncbi:esterase/lipase family protein [Scandinavium goeteborgense]|uniref:esterase/lipase family protein n=1 Tax=Scandinavium goeteborgense TaxID=1851514 RepID=UPI000F65D217|nr:acetyltransferase [Scandinavium goeteborgense]QKN81409.1 acetyltransferase [Scandinavium goeteborgense]